MNKMTMARALLFSGLLVSATATAQPLTPERYHGFGVTVTREGEWVTVNGHVADKTEYNADADVFSHGAYRIVFHKRTGRVRLMEEGRYLGVLK